MGRRLVLAAVLAITTGCSDATKPLPPETFTGNWRAVTAPYEHLRLTVNENAALSGALHVKLTFSGVAWEGPGRIEADSLIMDMTTSSMSGAAVIAHPAAEGALSVRVQSSAAAPLALTFVRDR